MTSYLASLSISSPKPGVSTIVRETQVRSSSSSSSVVRATVKDSPSDWSYKRTNGNGLDLKPLLRVGATLGIRVRVRQNAIPTEHIDEGGPACTDRSICPKDSFPAGGGI